MSPSTSPRPGRHLLSRSFVRAPRLVVVTLSAAALVLGVAGSLATQSAARPAAQYVVFVAPGDGPAVAAEHGLSVLGSTTGAIDSITVDVGSGEARRLSTDPRVSALAENVVFEALADRITPVVARVGATEGPVLAGTSTAAAQGAIAVLDTGVDTHPDYAMVGGVDCVGTSNYLSDTNGHGTGVAGAAASYSNGSGIVGTSPGARIYSVRVLDSKLKGTLANITCGLNWVVQNAARFDIRVANMSFGAAGVDDGNCGLTNDDVFHQAVCALVAAGVVPVAAAGNGNTDFSGQVPAAYDEVLTATNVVDFDGKPGRLAQTKPCSTSNVDDTAAAASNFAAQPGDHAHTVAAPGECPFTTLKGNRYGYIQSGTSMSSAAASGVVLDCLQPGQPCAGQSPKRTLDIVVASAAARPSSEGFLGDPYTQVGDRYRGYLVTTRFVDAPAPSTTPSTETSGSTAATSQSTTSEAVSSSSASATPSASTAPTMSVAPTTATADPTSAPATTPPTTTAAGTTTAAPTTTTAPTTTAETTTASPTTAAPTTTALPTTTAETTTSAPTTTTASPTTATSTTAAPTTTAPPTGRDTTKPVVTILTPESGRTVGGSVVSRASASDDRGVTSVRYYSGSTYLGPAQLVDGVWEFVYNTSSMRNGTYSITARAYDAAGNVGVSQAVSIVVMN